MLTAGCAQSVCPALPTGKIRAAIRPGAWASAAQPRKRASRASGACARELPDRRDCRVGRARGRTEEVGEAHEAGFDVSLPEQRLVVRKLLLLDVDGGQRNRLAPPK